MATKFQTKADYIRSRGKELVEQQGLQAGTAHTVAKAEHSRISSRVSELQEQGHGKGTATTVAHGEERQRQEKAMQTGERGGQYYISPTGAKVYQKQSRRRSCQSAKPFYGGVLAR